MSEAPADRKALKRAAVRSSIWSLTGLGGGQMLRFVSGVAFTYLIAKEALALMVPINAVIQGLQMFSDIGIGPSIVQDERGDDRRFIGTAFTLQVLRGLLMAAVCYALTYPVAASFAANNPGFWDLERLLPVAALMVFLASFGSMRLFTASRHLAVGHVVRIDLISQLFGAVVTMSWALYSRDVLALLIGGLASTICKVVLSHTVLPGERDRFAWDPTALRSIFKFGGWIFISTITSFFAMQIDRIVFAAAFPAETGGDFYYAAMIAAMLPMVIGSLQLSVVFPLYSRIRNIGDEMMPVLVRVKGAVFTLSGLLVACMIAGGQPFVDFVFPANYVDAGWMVALLAVGAWFNILESLYGAAMLARGKAQWVALSNVAKPIVFLTIFFVGGDRLTIPDVVLASVVADVAKGLLSMWGASRLGVLTLKLDLLSTAKVLAIGGCGWLLTSQMRDGWGLPTLLTGICAGVFCVAGYAPTLLASLRILRERRSAA